MHTKCLSWRFSALLSEVELVLMTDNGMAPTFLLLVKHFTGGQTHWTHLIHLPLPLNLTKSLVELGSPIVQMFIWGSIETKLHRIKSNWCAWGLDMQNLPTNFICTGTQTFVRSSHSPLTFQCKIHLESHGIKYCCKLKMKYLAFWKLVYLPPLLREIR